MKQFIIMKITPDRFEVVNGTDLGNGLFAHKGSSFVNWCVSDIKSGRSVQTNFNSLAACKEFANNIPEDIQTKLEAARNCEEYKVACEEVKKLAEENFEKMPKYYEQFVSMTGFDELFEELAETEQDKLF